MKWLITAFVFVSLTVSAQTLKWSFTSEGSQNEWATDGSGGLAIVAYVAASGGPDFIRTYWMDGSGRPILTNDLAVVGDSTDFRIVRCNRSEVAIFVEVGFDNAEGTNFLRRFKRNGTFTDTGIPLGETMDRVASRLLDNRGFFTRIGNTFRRYTN